MKATLIGSTAVVAILASGCSTSPDGKEVASTKEVFSHEGVTKATPVSPGVIVGAPAPYSGGGDVAICVKWTAAQAATLQGKANWWIDITHPITSTGVFSAGTYTVHFGPCSVSGYTAPPAKTISVPTPDTIVTLTVTYGHA